MPRRKTGYFFKKKRTIIRIGAVKVDCVFPVLQMSHSQLDILSPELSFPAFISMTIMSFTIEGIWTAEGLSWGIQVYVF